MIELTPSRIEILKIWAKDFLRIYQTEDFTKEELEFIEEILSNEPERLVPSDVREDARPCVHHPV